MVRSYGQVAYPDQAVHQEQVTSHPGEFLDLLGDQAQSLIDCNQKLKDLGIDDTIKLPQICVIGDQSAGKSSLIEAISKIQVPKADGCCTQCPVAINLKSGADASAPWECKVVVERHYDFIKGRKTTKSNPFGPWQPKDNGEIIEFATTRDRSHVPDLIRKAQDIALGLPNNVTTGLRHPVEQSDAGAALFSPNTVRLDVSEGIRPNLSFLDLPGVIANTAKSEDRHLITLVDNLVRHYAQDERSVNLLALPMTADVETSRALSIIQDIEAESRTLAVFTKPDRAVVSIQSRFLHRFLTQEGDLRFEQGYHFVMMDSSAKTDLAARGMELGFFGLEPWAGLTGHLRDRLGIPALSRYLRSSLFLKTRETLPANLEAITRRLQSVGFQLSQLPPPPDNSQVIISLSKDLSDFEIELGKALFKGRASLNAIAELFRASIVDNKPIVLLKSWTEGQRYNQAQTRLEMIQAGKPVEDSDAETEDISPVTSRPMMAVNKHGPVYKFRLDDIRDINKAHRSAFVPGEIEPLAIEAMNKLSVKFWDKALDEYMKNNSTLLRKQILDAMYKVFERHRHLEIFTIVDEWIRKFVDDTVQDQWSYAEEVCSREMELPLTLDQELLQEKEQQCLAERRSKRRATRAQLIAMSLDAKEGKVRNNRPEAKEEKLGPDPFDIEIQMSAKNRAYYEVAASRFVDVVCQGVFCRLVPQFREPVMHALKEHLGIDKAECHAQIIAWMAEDKLREGRRQTLIHEQKKLQEGDAYIRKVLGYETASSPTKRRSTDVDVEMACEDSPSKRKKLVHRPGSAPIETATTDTDDADGMKGVETVVAPFSKKSSE